MKKCMMIMSFAVILMANQTFAAQTRVCKKGKAERRIEITSTDPHNSIPCQVKSYKESDNQGKVLWSAQKDALYCKTKATEFAAQLSSSGWNCSGSKLSKTKSKIIIPYEIQSTTDGAVTPKKK